MELPSLNHDILALLFHQVLDRSFVSRKTVADYYAGIRDLALTCRSWNTILTNPYFYAVIPLGFPDTFVRRVLHKSRSAPLLIIDASTDAPDDSQIATVASCCDRWRGLELGYSAGRQLYQAGVLDQVLKNLEYWSLDLQEEGSTSWFGFLDSSSFPSIRTIALSGRAPATCVFASPVLKEMQEISIKIDGDIQPPSDLLPLLMAQNPRLRSLDLRISGITNFDEFATAKGRITMHHLESLVLALPECPMNSLMDRVWVSGKCTMIDITMDADNHWALEEEVVISMASVMSLKTRIIQLFATDEMVDIEFVKPLPWVPRGRWRVSNFCDDDPLPGVHCVRLHVRDTPNMSSFPFITSILCSARTFSGILVFGLDPDGSPIEMLQTLCAIPKLYRVEIDLNANAELWRLIVHNTGSTTLRTRNLIASFNVAGDDDGYILRGLRKHFEPVVAKAQPGIRKALKVRNLRLIVKTRYCDETFDDASDVDEESGRSGSADRTLQAQGDEDESKPELDIYLDLLQTVMGVKHCSWDVEFVDDDWSRL